MGALVFLQVTTLGESLGTKLTFIWSLPRMDSFMITEEEFICKGLVTNTTSVHLTFVFVRLLMALKEELVRKFLMANKAGIHVASVYTFVVSEAIPLRESFAANMTNEWFLPSVGSEMDLQVPVV